MEEELSDWEKDAMQRMEAKFALSALEESPFKELPVLLNSKVRSTEFVCYHNTKGLDLKLQTENSESVSGADIPILVYSEKNRFRYILGMLMNSWSVDLDILLAGLLTAEQAVRNNSEIPAETEEELSSFGVEVTADGYTIGYHGGSHSPVFMARDLLTGILKLYCDAAGMLKQQGRYPDSLPESGLDKIDELIRITEKQD